MDIWSWNNAADAPGAVFSSTAGSEGELLVSNLRDPRVGKIWRAGSMPATLNIAFGQAGAICVFGLFGANLSQLGSITLRLGTANQSGDLWQTSFEPDTLGLSHQAVFVLTNPTTGLAAPVLATHASVLSTTGDPLEIGRVWVGGADWQPRVGHTVRASRWGSLDLSQRSITPRSGTYLIDRGARKRLFTADYDALYPEEYGHTLFDMDERGLAQQMLMVPRVDVYDPHRYSVLGYLEDMPETAFLGYLRAGRTISIREAG